MSKVTIPTDSYKQFQGDFRKVKAMSLNNFILWVRSIHKTAYDEGWNEAVDAFKNARGKVNINNEVDAVVLDAEDLLKILLSVKGIGERRAQEVMEKVTGKSHEEDNRG